MTATILDSADWLTLSLFAFAFVGALAIAFSYRYFRRKPAPPTPMQLGLLIDHRRECCERMHKYRLDLAEGKFKRNGHSRN